MNKSTQIPTASNSPAAKTITQKDVSVTLNSYTLSRTFFDFAFENPDKIKPVHIALYFWAVELCNRLGWANKFNLPTTVAMQGIGIHSYNTYIKSLTDLVNFGFLNLIKKSKNQHTSNIVELSKFNKALDKALDKALIKHNTKQSESTVQSTSESKYSIIKQVNNETREPLNKETLFKEKNNSENLIKEFLDDKSQIQLASKNLKKNESEIFALVLDFRVTMKTEYPNVDELRLHFQRWAKIKSKDKSGMTAAQRHLNEINEGKKLI
ncbi:MAG: hypothetical protein PSX36_06770 [bacterium]|nr:hypothetical protein [bacterium]